MSTGNTDKKAQALYIDFIIGLIIFGVALLIYYTYNVNYQPKDQNDLDVLISNARSVTSTLVLSGYPNDWNSSNVLRIGITDEQKLNYTKAKRMKQLNYSFSKKSFATYYDYYIFFRDNDDNVINVNGVCGIGHASVNSTFSSKVAYYYSSGSHSALKSLMTDSLNADVYHGNMVSLVTNINNYDFIVMEYPSLSAANYALGRNPIENFVSNGGYLMVTGELTTAGANDFAGSNFNKKADQSPIGRNSTVNISYTYSYLPKENIMFNESYYVNNLSTASNFKKISTFNSDLANAISTWDFGNGNVYFLSDTQGMIAKTNFTPFVEDIAVSFMRGFCTEPNMTKISIKKLATLNRYVSYNSNAVKMVIYIWL